MITQMTMAHVDEVAGVHLRGLEGYFLTSLGPQFLRLYYENIVEYSDAVGYVWVEDGHVIGFVSGTVSPSRFYSHLLRTRWLRFALAALGAAIRRPSIVPHLARAWLYPSQTSNRRDDATLTFIAIEPAMQGKGIGSNLMATFLEDFRARGVKRVDLVANRYDNDQANAFYQKQGFHCERTSITPEGIERNEYAILLDQGGM